MFRLQCVRMMMSGLQCVDDDVETQYVYIMLRLQCVWMMM